MKLLYFADLAPGATSLHRLEAFEALGAWRIAPYPRVEGGRPGLRLISRARSSLGWPADHFAENGRLLDATRKERPDIVLVDNSRVIERKTLSALRTIGVRLLVYYSPDDVIAPHNLSLQTRGAMPEWDVFFTTKSFNVAELIARGVRRPRLIGNAFHESAHRPMTPAEVGAEFERFDMVFAGAFERARGELVRRLARSGMTVVVHGASAGLLRGDWRSVAHPNIVLRPPAVDAAYRQALHTGKVALCFLRKMNRDQITTRSIEIPACARPMLAEKTDEHDAHFRDGFEYLGFSSADELVAKARRFLADEGLRSSIATAGRARCLSSAYSTNERAKQMAAEIELALAGSPPEPATSSGLSHP